MYRLNVVKETCSISLNASELGIKNIGVVQNNLQVEVSSYVIHNSEEILQIKLEKPLIPGGDYETTTLKIDFIGSINDKMAGFYRSSYEVDGVTK